METRMILLNVIIFSMAVIAAIAQILGARIEPRPCKHIKYAYALSLFIAALFVFMMEIVEESEYGYAMALFVILFQVLVGAVVRYLHLKRKPKEYLDCEH